MAPLSSAAPAGDGAVLWFRQDVRRDLTRAWLRAFAFVVAAMALLALPLGSAETPDGWRVAGWIAGGACLLAGPLHLLFALRRILGPEIYLVLTPSGLVWRVGDHSRSIPWDRVAAVRPRPTAPAAVVVAVEGEPDLVLDRPLIALEPAALAELLAELRQKALLGLPVRPRQAARAR